MLSDIKTMKLDPFTAICEKLAKSGEKGRRLFFSISFLQLDKA